VACTCVPPASPREEAARSMNTFVGTVESIRTIAPPEQRELGPLRSFIEDVRSVLTGRKALPKPPTFEPYQIVTFKVSQTFKGAHSGFRRINAGESNSTCSYHFQHGQEYVVYTFNREGRLAAGQCSRTGLATEPRTGLLGKV
jgi:hypothetical protein